MPLVLDDTIAAPASPPGAAERGIIRISGPQMLSIVRSVFRPGSGFEQWMNARVPSRFPGVADIPSLGVPLPVQLMLWPTRHSFTGQPMAEFHCLSSPPLMDALLERLFECDARPAQRGEFTMRAFLAGRIDLLQAEAVLGVIEATDHEELQQALTQLGGAITSRLVSLRADLIAVLGDLEAGLDFVEEDIEFITREEIVRRLNIARQTLHSLLADAEQRLPSGWKRRVVLAGLPNAGKSTLFNRMVGSHKAIVSPIPGTTRDYLSACVSLVGGSQELEIELIDTAGCEDAADLIMDRAQQIRGQQVNSGDLIVWCRSLQLNSQELAEDEQLRRSIETRGLPLLHITTQCDLATKTAAHPNHRTGSGDTITQSDLAVSAMTGEGIDLLRQTIIGRLIEQKSARGELLATTAVRCRDSLTRAISAIESAIMSASAGSGDELTAMDLRESLHELGVILGDVCTDDILDHIFSRFCIGK